MKTNNQDGRRLPVVFILLFIFLAVGIIAAGYFYYNHSEKNFRTGFENQLSAIAELKVGELVQWRKERLGDGNVFYKNELFTELVKRYFKNRNDRDAEKRILTWMRQVQIGYNYSGIFLLDTQCTKRIFLSKESERSKAFVSPAILDSLKSGKIVFEDFYRNEALQKIFIKTLVPIIDDKNNHELIAIVQLRIDPEQYLYPLINKWPAPSKTAETLIIRREGDSAVFLNELRFQKNTALHLRISLNDVDRPAVKAALGQEGIVEGVDYRGAPVIADVRAVPDSPWFLVARVDQSEIFAPLREKLWFLFFIVILLLAGTGAGIGFMLRNQRIRYYRERYRSAEALRESELKYRSLIESSTDVIFCVDEKGQYQFTNHVFASTFGKTPDYFNGKTFWDIYPKEHADYRYEAVKRVFQTGESESLDVVVPLPDKTLYFYATANPIKDETGKVILALTHATDITERKRVEDQLAHLYRQVQMILETAGEGIFGLDTEGNHTFVNPIAARMLGYKPDELIGRHSHTAWHYKKPDGSDYPREECQVYATLRDGSSHYGEEYFWRKDGSGFQVEFTSMPIIEAGRVVGAVVTFRDITERKQAEQLLESQNSQLRKLTLAIEQSSATIVITDLNGAIEYVNPKFVETTGYSAEEAIGQNPSILKSGEMNADNYGYLWHTIRKGNIWRGEFHNRRKDGSLYWEFASIAPVCNESGQVTHFIAVKEDITERKHLADQLKRLSDQFQMILETAGDGIFGLDTEGNHTFVNPMAAKMLGYRPEELIGRHSHSTWHYKRPDGSHNPGKTCLIYAMLRDGSTHSGEEYFWRKDGSGFPVEFTTSPILEAGQVVGAVVTFRDITERKKAEEEMKRNDSRLRSILNIMQYPSDNVQNFLDYALNEAIQLTESKIGYIYYYHENRKEFVLNSWSKDVMKECLITEPQTCYELDKTGLWGEAVRQRKAIIVNDFEAAHPLKKGYPEGHAKLFKYMTIPIFDNNRIVAVVGVANRTADYTETDVLQLTLFMDAVWNAVDRQRVGQELKESENRYRDLFENSMGFICLHDLEGNITAINPAAINSLGYTPDELAGKNIQDLLTPEFRNQFPFYLSQIQTEKKAGGLMHMRTKDQKDMIWQFDNIINEDPGHEPYILSHAQDITNLEKSRIEREQLISELTDALKKVKTLSGLLPICASCKKIRDDKGYWHQIENYIVSHSEADFSHSICSDCQVKLYPELFKEDKK